MEWNYIHFHRIETRGRDVKKNGQKKKNQEKSLVKAKTSVSEQVITVCKTTEQRK